MQETPAERAARAAAEARALALREDPGRRRAHGVVATPAPVARAVARLALSAARRVLPDGPWCCVDPACGTGVFGAAWLAALEEACLDARGGALVCLDVDGAAVAAAREALGPAAGALGVGLDARVVDDALASLDLGPERGAPEAVVVLGNPPWAGCAAHRGGPLGASLLADFRDGGDGAPGRRRKIGVLSDAYVRFVRWGLALVERAPAGGVIAMVTNGSYLDGPMHRGMRAYLRGALDTVTAIDLGGSALVGRIAGDRDDNVFGVRTSVAVLVGARARRVPGAGRGLAAVRVAALRGSAAEKTRALLALSASHEAPAVAVATTAQAGAPWTPAPSVSGARAAYDRWPALDALFSFHAEGLQTNRDAALVDVDRARLLDRLARFAAGREDPDLAPLLRPLPHYAPDRARAALRAAFGASPDGGAFVRRILYRPFDERYACTLFPLAHRPRPAAARAVDRSTLCLVSTGHDRGAQPFAHVLFTRLLPDNCALSARSSCRARVFPSHQPGGEPNVDAARLGPRGGAPLAPEDAVAYAGAVLLAPAYRARFDAALRASSPRVVPAPDAPTRDRIVAAGRALARLFTGDAPVAPGALGPAPPLVLGHHRVHEALVAQRGAAHASALAPRLAAVAAAIDALDAVVLPALAAHGAV